MTRPRTSLAVRFLRRFAVGLTLVACVATTSHAQPRQRSAGNFVVSYWPGHERLAEHLLTIAPDLSRLPAVPPDLLLTGDSVRIYLAPDEDRFHQLAGERVPEWGAGIAIPEASTVVLPVFGGRNPNVAVLTRVLRHELAHLALERFLAPARPPRWFDEGYARWAAGEWDWDSGWQLRFAFAMQRAPPLDSIALSWPTGAVDARVAYMLATSAVDYLIRRSGEYGLELMLRRWREGATLDDAMRQTYGMTVAQFEMHWSKEVRRRYGWAYVLSHTLVFWASAAVLLLFLFAWRRRRDRERLGRLRAQEPPDSPAFWLGEEAEPPMPEAARPGDDVAPTPGSSPASGADTSPPR